MVFFLYCGFICAIVAVVFLLNKQTKKVTKAKIISRFIIVDMVIGIIILGIVGFCIPYLMWGIYSKDVVPTEMIVEEGEIKPIDGDIYIKEKNVNDVEVYLINIGNEKQKDIKYISKDRAVIKGKGTVGATEYQEVVVYNMKRIKSESFLARQLNEMFANVYIKNKDAVYKDRKVNVYLPSGYKVGKEQ